MFVARGQITIRECFAGSDCDCDLGSGEDVAGEGGGGWKMIISGDTSGERSLPVCHLLSGVDRDWIEGWVEIPWN